MLCLALTYASGHFWSWHPQNQQQLWKSYFCFETFHLGAIHILRNRGQGGGGLPDLLQYYIGGGLTDLLQYYIGVGRPIEMFFIWMISEEEKIK